MTPRLREMALGAAVLLVVLLGVAYGALVHAPERVRLANSIALRGTSFSSRATYCPPSVTRTLGRTRLAVTSTTDKAIPVSVEPAETPTPEPQPTVGGAGQPTVSPSPAASLGGRTPGPSSSAPQHISPGRAMFAPSEEGRGVNVVGYAGSVVASAAATGRSGAGAAGCSSAAGRHWYFAAGSSDLGYDERLILYNPFPDEAVVRVSFVTPKGTQSKVNLSDQAVASGATSVLRLNSFILKERLLSVQVDAVRGRVVAWRYLLAHPRHQPHGEQFSLGATNSYTESFLPDGHVGPGYNEQIALLNPNDRAARVSISVLTSKRTVQPPKLLDITVPPASSKAVHPAAAMKGCRDTPCSMGAVVSSTNGVGVVAERTISYSTGHLQGVASEIATPRTALHWYLGPASLDPTRDSVIVVNPTTADASVSLEFQRARGAALSPHALQHIKVKAGTRAEVRIDRWTSGHAVVAVLSSTQQVAAERFSYSRRAQDASEVMGRPLP
jgi:Family of unknown function (DUF5719)